MARKYDGLKSAMIDNEKLVGTSLYKTVNDLAAEWAVKPLTVYQLRHRLGLAGNVTPKSGDPKQTPVSATLLPAVTTTEGLLKVLEDEPLLTSSDRLRILSRLIRTGAPAVKIQAIKTYEDLTRVTVERVGPPDPLTDDEAVARLARIMLAIGPELTLKAQEVAFGTEEEEPSAGEPTPSLPADPPPTPQAEDIPGLPVQDLREDPNSSSGS